MANPNQIPLSSAEILAAARNPQLRRPPARARVNSTPTATNSTLNNVKPNFIAWAPPARLQRDDNQDLSDFSFQSNMVENPRQANADPLAFGSGLSCVQKFKAILAYLQKTRLSPADFMIYVLDTHSTDLDRYRVGLYKQGGKLAEMMDKIMGDERGAERLREWMQPHVVEATCAIVDQEMELAKECLTMPMNHVGPDFINAWSLESTTGQVAITKAPTLLRVLERAASSDRALARNKKKNSRQVISVLCLTESRVLTYVRHAMLLSHSLPKRVPTTALTFRPSLVFSSTPMDVRVRRLTHSISVGCVSRLTRSRISSSNSAHIVFIWRDVLLEVPMRSAGIM
jgi:hypothetical protein